MDSHFNYFHTANEAKKELDAVQVLTKKLSGSSPETAYKIYCKLAEQDMFHSAIGIDFMNTLEEYLIQKGVLEKKKEPLKEPENAGMKIMEQLKQTKDRLTTSLILNGILILAIAVMIYIASTGSNVHILNYETALQDRYSSWEQELKNKENQLKEREKVIMQKEEALKIRQETETE